MTRRFAHADRGLTLVEVLVAMGLLGIVLLLVTDWQTQTLTLTARTNAQADQLAELNDLSGYLGDRIRSAAQVRLSGFTVNAASAVNNGKCDTTTPCVAVLSLEEDADPSTSPPTITRRWLRLVYRVEPRATWTGADKVPDTWADDPDNAVRVLREYRDSCTEVSGGTCSVTGGSPAITVAAYRAAFTGAAFSGMSPALVADYLTAVDQAGTAIVPFALTAAQPVGAANPVILTFQSVRNVRGTVAYTPGAGAYRLSVQARNVP